MVSRDDSWSSSTQLRRKHQEGRNRLEISGDTLRRAGQVDSGRCIDGQWPMFQVEAFSTNSLAAASTISSLDTETTSARARFLPPTRTPWLAPS